MIFQVGILTFKGMYVLLGLIRFMENIIFPENILYKVIFQENDYIFQCLIET